MSAGDKDAPWHISLLRPQRARWRKVIAEEVENDHTWYQRGLHSLPEERALDGMPEILRDYIAKQDLEVSIREN